MSYIGAGVEESITGGLAVATGGGSLLAQVGIGAVSSFGANIVGQYISKGEVDWTEAAVSGIAGGAGPIAERFVGNAIKKLPFVSRSESVANAEQMLAATKAKIRQIGDDVMNRIPKLTPPDPTKPLHSVFNVSKDKVLGVVDEAWSMRSGVTPRLQKNGNQVFNISMGRVVGTNGETSMINYEACSKCTNKSRGITANN